MKIRLAPQVLEKIPGISVAVVVLKNIKNTQKNSTIAQLLRGACAAKKSELKNEKEKEKIKNLLEPTLSQGAVLGETYLLDSFLRKISKGIEIKSENNATDLIHYLSLKHLTPLHGRDLDLVDQDIEIGFVTPKKGKKPQDLSLAKETQHLVLWLVNIGNALKEDFEKLPAEFAKIIQKYCKGAVAINFILTAEEPEVDLGYISEKERLFQEEQQEAKEQRIKNPPQVSVEGGSPALATEIDSPQKLTEKAPALEDLLSSSPPPVVEPLIRDVLKAELGKIVAGLESTLEVTNPLFHESVELQAPREKSHGDYATNVALKLGKALGKNPYEIAEAVIKNLPTLPYIERTEIAGAGFVNFYLSTTYLEQELQKILNLKNYYGRLPLETSQKVVIDYSSPNIAKPLGVHHLLSTIIGQTIYNMMRFAGYDPVAANYLGDWGTQFGKLIYAYRTWGDQAQIEKDPLNELLKLYVRFHDEAEKEPELEKKGQEEFKKLEEGDEENRKLWNWIRDISLKELERLYQKLGITFDVYLPESIYEDAMKDVLKEGKEKGIFVTGEKGALIVQFENDQYPPYMIQKADGATLYSTRDLASIKDRITRYHPTKLIYVVDVAQSLHFKQLFATAKKFGIEGVEFTHAVFGRMQFADGSMSTRKGKVIKIEELLEEAVERAAKIVAEKNPEISAAEEKIITEGVAFGAIKYHLLSQNRETNLTFDWDRMLALDGNSAPYLQYSYARAHSILRKAKDQKPAATHPPKNSSQTDIFSVQDDKKTQAEADLAPFAHPREQELLHLLVKFPEHLEQAVQSYKPNLITNYLYELAQTFSSFYQEVQVLTTTNQEVKKARLQLVAGVAQILKNGLNILGISVFEKM